MPADAASGVRTRTVGPGVAGGASSLEEPKHGWAGGQDGPKRATRLTCGLPESDERVIYSSQNGH